jgi:hypothetical protein
MISRFLKWLQARPSQRWIEFLAFDKAAGDEKVHHVLDAAGIRPLIENCDPTSGSGEETGSCAEPSRRDAL